MFCGDGEAFAHRFSTHLERYPISTHMGLAPQRPSAPPGVDPVEAARLSAFSNAIAKRSPVSLVEAPDEAAEVGFDVPLLGSYRVTGTIGTELDAELIRAVQLRVGGDPLDCVLKRLHRAESSADGRRRQRLFTEGQASMGLTHPNVVQVIDYGALDGWICLAREYVEGASLRAIRQLAAGQQLPVSVVVFLGYQIADALACAHEHAEDSGTRHPLVHGRLCPSDILVTPAGDIKITEMGVAAFGPDQVPYPDAGSRWRLRYMAPEQVRRELLDRRSDIFSLGLLMSELLGPRALAPDAGIDFDALAKVVRMRSSVRNDVPGALTRLLVNMTAVAPEARPQSARQIANALAIMAAEFGDREALDKQLRSMLAGAVDSIARRNRTGPFGSLDPTARAPLQPPALSAPPQPSDLARSNAASMQPPAPVLSAVPLPGSVARRLTAHSFVPPAPVLSAVPLPGSVARRLTAHSFVPPAPVLSAVPLPGSVAGEPGPPAAHAPVSMPAWANQSQTMPPSRPVNAALPDLGMAPTLPGAIPTSVAPMDGPPVGTDSFAALDVVLNTAAIAPLAGMESAHAAAFAELDAVTGVTASFPLESLSVPEDTVTRVASLTLTFTERHRRYRVRVAVMALVLTLMLAGAVLYFGGPL